MTDDASAAVERLEDLKRTAIMLRAWAPAVFPEVDVDGRVHFGRAMMESAADAIETALASVATEEPVAWRVRVRSDDPEEWSLLPAGAGADYLHRLDYEVQPLFVAHIAALEARAERAEQTRAEYDRWISESVVVPQAEYQAMVAREAELRSALEKIDGAISAGITETDGPARVKAEGDTRIEDGFIVGQFAIQFELVMKCMQNICRQALAAAPAAREESGWLREQVNEAKAERERWPAGVVPGRSPSEDLRADERRIDGLRELCGYVEDGSDIGVSISQDDATRDWIIRAGKRWWHGRSLREAIDAALEGSHD